MKLKIIILGCMCNLFFNFVLAQNWLTVFEATFEEGEDLSVWHLQNAEEYTPIAKYTHQDNFFIGNAVSFMGENSLYVSEDGGVSNNITSDREIIISTADLNINLQAGSYVIEFTYKLPEFHIISLSFLTERFIETFPIEEEEIFLTNTYNVWSFKSIPFTVVSEINWIVFAYNFQARRDTTTEGFAIDNIVIRKKDTSTLVSQSTASNFSIITQPLQITVENTDDIVQIHNISGVLVAQGSGAGVYSVPQAGVYIVRVGNEVQKVIVN